MRIQPPPLITAPRRTSGLPDLRTSGFRGEAALTVALVDGLSAAVATRHADPARLIVSRPRGASVRAWLTTFGGGLVEGDAIGLSIAVDDGARAMLTTQASTKCYRCPAGTGARQDAELSVGAGAVLACLPDPVAPFADAVFAQRTRCRLAPGAGLALLDAVTSGRGENGERWAMTRLRLRTTIRDTRLVADEALHLDAASAGHLAGIGVIATLWLVGSPMAATAAHAASAIATLPLRGPVQAAGSPLTRAAGGGLVVRYAADHPERLALLLRDHLAPLRDLLDDDPWHGRS